MVHRRRAGDVRCLLSLGAPQLAQPTLPADIKPRNGVGQIEYVPVPPPLELDPLPEPLLEDENDDPLDLLPEPLLEPLEGPDVEPDPEPDAEPEPETEAEPLPLVCAVASATPLVAISAGRSLCVHTPSAE